MDTSNVVKGPWKRVKQVVVEDNQKIKDDIEFVEELTEVVTISIVAHFKENGFPMESQSMAKYLPFVSECIRAGAYKDLGYGHKMSKLMDEFIKEKNVDKEDGTQYYGVDMEKVEELTED